MGSQAQHGFSIQSNKHDYARLFQVVLRRRAYHFCVISYLASVFVLWLAILDGIPALWNGLRITTWIMAGASWASAIVPVMTLRRIQLTAPRLYAPTRYTKFGVVLRSTEFITSTIFCVIGGSLLCSTYVLTALALNENPDLHLFKAIPGRGATQINERPIYLWASCCYTALCYSFCAVYGGKWRYHPSDVPEHHTIPHRIVQAFGSRLGYIRRAAIYCSITFLPIYSFFRRFIIRTIIFSKYTQLTKHIKPHMVMLIKFDSVFTLTSTYRLVMLNLLMITMWEVVRVLWDVYSTHPLDLSRFDTEPNQCLLEGIKSSDPRVQYYALREFAHISWSDPARRATIFKDIRSSPRLMNLIIQESLKVIQTTKTMIESRGQSIQTLTIGPTPNSSGARKSSPGVHSALKNDLPQLFKSPNSNANSIKEALLTKLISTGQEEPLSGSAESTLPAGSSDGRKASEYQIPEIFRRDPSRKSGAQAVTPRSSASVDTPTLKASQPTSSPIKSSTVGKKREKMVPTGWKILFNERVKRSSDHWPRLEDWLFSPSMTDELEQCLSDRQLCIFVVEAVTNFTCASLTEDQYGVLQEQIPSIMETFIDCFEALDRLRADICTEFGLPSAVDQPQPPSSSSDLPLLEPQQTRYHQALDEYLYPLLTRLKTGAVGIADQFQPFLKEMALSPKITTWIHRHSR